MSFKQLLFVTVSLMISTRMGAIEPDAAGCQDSSAINRMDKCRIDECKPRDFDAVSIQVGPQDPNTREAKTKSVEGRVEEITYECLREISPLLVVRNFKNAFIQAGFNTVYEGPYDAGMAAHGGRTVTLESQGRYAFVEAHGYAERGTFYTEIVVTPQDFQQQLKVDANQLEAEIKKNKHVAVYGVEFDVDSAVLRPASDAVLQEIVTLLKNNPAWKLKIEGHTDSTGAKARHQKLSLDRATAVVKWLVGRKIESARLVPAGFGDTKPVATNDTEAGRAKNRRVELVKQ